VPLAFTIWFDDRERDCARRRSTTAYARLPPTLDYRRRSTRRPPTLDSPTLDSTTVDARRSPMYTGVG